MRDNNANYSVTLIYIISELHPSKEIFPSNHNILCCLIPKGQMVFLEL